MHERLRLFLIGMPCWVVNCPVRLASTSARPARVFSMFGLAGMVKNLSNMIVSRCCDWKQAMSEVMTARQAGLNFTRATCIICGLLVKLSEFDLVVGLR